MKLVLDTHNHTIASGHAYSTMLEYVKAAKKRKLELIAITDHAPAMRGGTSDIYFMNFRVVPEYIEGVKVMMGVELNVMNKAGEVDIKEEWLKELSPVIASFHPPVYKFAKDDMTDAKKCDEITETILRLMDNKYVQIIGHLGDPRFPFDIERVVKKSVKTGTLIEINNSSLSPLSFRTGSEENIEKILLCCKKHDCPIVVGSDAHFAGDTGRFKEAKRLIEALNFPKVMVANTSVKLFLKLLGDART